MKFQKALTFSFDDGVTQDRRLVDLLDRYGLKATFNLNSSLLGCPGSLELPSGRVAHNKVEPDEVASLYRGHEVAAHTLTHAPLTQMSDGAVARQVEEDRLALTRLTGVETVGLAYPGGGRNHDDRVVEAVRKFTGVKYARTILSSYALEFTGDLLRYSPSIHLGEPRTFEVVENFLRAERGTLYVWGHSYEYDVPGNPLGWDGLEDLFRLVSGRADVFYGTNRDVLLG